MTTQDLRGQIDHYTTRLKDLIRRGAQLRDGLLSGSGDQGTIPAIRAWQEECGVTINQLSGGSKGHWLARSFSEAFLMRSSGGQAAEGAPTEEIVKRLIQVLEQGTAALSQKDDVAITSGAAAAEPHRFDFVHNAEIRPVLEQAYIEGRQALEQGEYELAIRTSCGILEAIVTDALERSGVLAASGLDVPPGKISEWPFESRLAIAEKLRLIRGGCARLPQVARTYRDSDEASLPVTEQDAKRTSQVLHVIMRD
ncbi:MAG: hypothetical protein WBW49_25240, partial [Candidatus Acidiferrum sp.]